MSVQEAVGDGSRGSDRWAHQNACVDLRDDQIITTSDSDASPADIGVHWDFGTSSSARRIQFTGHFKGIKEEDGAQEVAIGFSPSDDAEEVNRDTI